MATLHHYKFVTPEARQPLNVIQEPGPIMMLPPIYQHVVRIFSGSHEEMLEHPGWWANNLDFCEKLAEERDLNHRWSKRLEFAQEWLNPDRVVV
jgi:hypothetical protein